MSVEIDPNENPAKKTAWLSIWTRPRSTIREIVKTGSSYGYYFLCAVYGFPLFVSMVQSLSLGYVMPLGVIVLLAVIFSTFVGMAGISIWSGILYYVGKGIEGKASYKQLRTAVAWSNLPCLVQTVGWIALIAVFGAAALDSNFVYMQFTPGEALFVMGVFLLQAIAGIWSFFILLFSLSEVQEYPLWKSLVNIVIPSALLVGALWLLTGIVR